MPLKQNCKVSQSSRTKGEVKKWWRHVNLSDRSINSVSIILSVTSPCLPCDPRRGSRNFSKGGGGLRRKILEEKCLLIHVSTRVHIKTRQTYNSFSLLPFQEDCLLFCTLFYYSLFVLKFEMGGCNPRNPPLDPPMYFTSKRCIKLTKRESTLKYTVRPNSTFFSLSHMDSKSWKPTCVCETQMPPDNDKL